MIRNVRLIIGFDGTRYEGWQSQRKEGRTIQEVFEKILERLMKEKTDLVSSSRTDSGVHALGMVAHFKTRSKLPDARLKAALNFHLPKDIVVFSAKTVDPSFHARYSAKSKLYAYRIWNQETRPLFEAPYVYWYPHPLNVSLMKKAARKLIGTHDFSAFMDAGSERKSYTRTIKRINIKKSNGEIRIEIQANGFLRHMVRIIVGTLIDIGRKKIPVTKISSILRSKNRQMAGPTAKAHGLSLLRVSYQTQI